MELHNLLKTTTTFMSSRKINGILFPLLLQDGSD